MANEKITAWSFSRWNIYENCPAQAKYKFIDKLPEKEGDALVRGQRIHKMAEDFMMKPKTKLPEELKPLAADFAKLRKVASHGAAELQVAFNRNWERVEWFGKGAWCRVQFDYLVYADEKEKEPTARVIDYKTGKIRGEYVEQLELYQLTGLLIDPVAKASTGELWFTDQGKIIGADSVISEVDKPKLKKKWEARVKPMLNDTTFAPKPGRHCTYCTWAKFKGGPCKY